MSLFPSHIPYALAWGRIEAPLARRCGNSK